MEKLYTVNQISQRYSCSPQCARNYIRRIDGHLESPLGVYESDLMRWEHSRRVGGSGSTMRISRKREG